MIEIFRCMMDTDDEVRDRATFFYHVLNEKDKSLSSAYILNSKSLHLSLSFQYFVAKYRCVLTLIAGNICSLKDTTQLLKIKESYMFFNTSLFSVFRFAWLPIVILS